MRGRRNACRKPHRCRLAQKKPITGLNLLVYANKQSHWKLLWNSTYVRSGGGGAPCGPQSKSFHLHQLLANPHDHGHKLLDVNRARSVCVHLLHHLRDRLLRATRCGMTGCGAMRYEEEERSVCGIEIDRSKTVQTHRHPCTYKARIGEHARGPARGRSWAGGPWQWLPCRPRAYLCLCLCVCCLFVIILVYLYICIGLFVVCINCVCCLFVSCRPRASRAPRSCRRRRRRRGSSIYVHIIHTYVNIL